MTPEAWQQGDEDGLVILVSLDCFVFILAVFAVSLNCVLIQLLDCRMHAAQSQI